MQASLWSLAILMGIAWTIASATTSWANFGGHGHHMRPDAASFIWHVLKAKDALNLSDEQQARLQTIAMNFKKENVKKTAEVELAEIDMDQLLHGSSKQAASGDRGEVETAVRKMYALKAERRLASIKALQEARTVLTPEQQQKLRELREQRHAAMDRSGVGQHDAYRHSDAR